MDRAPECDRGSREASRLVAPPETLPDPNEEWQPGQTKKLCLERADRMLQRILDATKLKKKHSANFATFAAMERMACREDPIYWLTNYAWTHDEHDREHPIKPFPIELPYWRHLVRAYLDIPIIALVKSRQELATWFFVLMDLWDTLFVPGCRTIFQSEHLEKAAALIKRCEVCYRKQPCWLVPHAEFNTYDASVSENSATILSVSRGVRQVAGYTLRNMFFDEANALEDFMECIAVAKPATRDGGRIHVVGTAFPGEWEQFWHGDLDRE